VAIFINCLRLWDRKGWVVARVMTVADGEEQWESPGIGDDNERSDFSKQKNLFNYIFD
jgi:hypothetical protein